MNQIHNETNIYQKINEGYKKVSLKLVYMDGIM